MPKSTKHGIVLHRPMPKAAVAVSKMLQRYDAKGTPKK